MIIRAVFNSFRCAGNACCKGVAVVVITTGSVLLSAMAAAASTPLATQRAHFVEGREMLAAGSVSAALEKRDVLSGYPLQSHFEYLILRQQIEAAEQPLVLLDKVTAFSKAYDDKRSHRRLLGVLKNRLARSDNWNGYATVAGVANAPYHPCDDLYSRVKSGRLKKFDTIASELWVQPDKHTKNCDSAFTTLIKRAGDVPTAALWQRTVALLTSGKKNQVEALLRFYSSRDKRIIKTWLDNIDKPDELLKFASVNGNMSHHQKLVTYLLRRWMREDLPAATEFWRRNGNAFGYNEKELDHAIGKHAVLAAKRVLPEAQSLLQRASGVNRDVRYWRVRMALRSGDWQSVLDALNALASKEQASTRWQYWRARALQALGSQQQANDIYKSLANKFEYYGFLAADKLSVDYNIGNANVVVDPKARESLLSDPLIARAVEFFRVDIPWEGRRAWNLALKGASEAKLIAAADYALSLGWHDRAFASMKKTDHKTALPYLFPMPHKNYIESVAAGSAVNEALLYGVMRQESGYIADVRSPAGATGLMQLMPATAKEVAKKIGIASPWKLIDAETSIRLGASYLDSVMRRFDGNVVLAAAAYNAGPSRVSRWISDTSLAADIWVETIPYDETRDYVKGVLFNATVSEWRLKSRVLTRLKTRMQDVLPLG